jgi:hypothetical protein
VHGGSYQGGAVVNAEAADAGLKNSVTPSHAAAAAASGI